MWALDHLDPGLSDPPDRMRDVPGIGPGIIRLIDEFRSTGTLAELQQLAVALPEDAAAMRRLPRMTPKILSALKGELGVDTLDDLEGALDSEDALVIPGVGRTTAETWMAVLALRPQSAAVPSFDAWVSSRVLSAHLDTHLAGHTAIAGEVRRLVEWVETLDLVCVPGVDRAGVDEFLQTSAAWSGGAELAPETFAITTHGGMNARVHLSTDRDHGSTMVRATGPDRHAEPLLAAVEPRNYPDESLVYRAAGRDWVPAPARDGVLDDHVNVVLLGDLRGDFHLHTDRSPDGRQSLESIVRAGSRRGFEYLLITDHTSGLRFGGLTSEELLLQSEEVAEIRQRFPGIRIFHGAELNIEQDGSLDVDEEALEALDFVVAGVHSYFGLGRVEQTERVLRGLEHPKVRVLAHPTGRRIGIRPGLSIDLERVVESAAARQIALEVNGHRDRLDLGADNIRMALAFGAVFAANSDAHRAEELDNVANAVGTLQRALVPAERVVNTWPRDELERWLARDL